MCGLGLVLEFEKIHEDIHIIIPFLEIFVLPRYTERAVWISILASSNYLKKEEQKWNLYCFVHCSFLPQFFQYISHCSI